MIPKKRNYCMLVSITKLTLKNISSIQNIYGWKNVCVFEFVGGDKNGTFC